MNSQASRRYLICGALAVVVVLSAVSGADRTADGDPAAKSPPRPAPPPRAAGASRATTTPPPPVQLEALPVREPPAETDRVATNPFTAMTWHVPPPAPKPVAKPPPPPPSAPPMPFAFLGRYEEGGKLTIMLVKGERVYMVAEGDVIDQTYRVERMAAGKLELTYLPLDVKQVISTGGP